MEIEFYLYEYRAVDLRSRVKGPSCGQVFFLQSTSHGEDKKDLLDKENCIPLKLPSYTHFSMQNYEVQMEKQFSCMSTDVRGPVDREYFCNLRPCLLRISNASKSYFRAIA